MKDEQGDTFDLKKEMEEKIRKAIGTIKTPVDLSLSTVTIKLIEITTFDDMSQQQRTYIPGQITFSMVVTGVLNGE